jgi:hypothetical protein
MDICMIYNINTVITTAPKIPRTLPAVVVDDDAVIACDFIIVPRSVETMPYFILHLGFHQCK